MIHHLVWFKMQDGSTPQQEEQLQQGLKSLTAAIPEIVALATGTDFSGRSRGYQVGLAVQMHTRADLDVYATHPVHLDFIASHKHLWQDVLALDFEV